MKFPQELPEPQTRLFVSAGVKLTHYCRFEMNPLLSLRE
jgi:hypothetical protein